MKATRATFFCLLAVATPAAADDDRCAKGAAFAAQNDLPRAYLYLETCTSDEYAKVRADVAHKLDNSKLSAMSIVTTPEGLVAETDALPGERFTTPATIWAKAGDYTINVAADAATLDAGKGITSTATLDKFSRRTVIINAPQKKQAPPKAGKVDFTDEAEETAGHTGPPPQQKFGSILPDKYRQKADRSGEGLLEDPLAYNPDSSSFAWKFSARVGGGIAVESTSNASPSVAVALLAARPLAGPVSLAARVGWLHREIDAGTVEVGVGVRVAASPSLVLRGTAAMRGEVRLQETLAMEDVARVGLGGAVGLDLALLALPVTIGLRAEPAFTELTPGVRAHAMMLELGYDWR